MLDELWLLITGETPGPPSMTVDEVASWATDEDEPTDRPLIAVAMTNNAVIALAYALQSATSEDSKLAVWAARQVTDALDLLLANALEVNVFDSSSELAVQSHPCMQAEISRQRRDLEMLGDARGHHEIACQLRAVVRLEEPAPPASY